MCGPGDDAARTLPAHECLGDDAADWRDTILGGGSGRALTPCPFQIVLESAVAVALSRGMRDERYLVPPIYLRS